MTFDLIHPLWGLAPFLLEAAKQHATRIRTAGAIATGSWGWPAGLEFQL